MKAKVFTVVSAGLGGICAVSLIIWYLPGSGVIIKAAE